VQYLSHFDSRLKIPGYCEFNSEGHGMEKLLARRFVRHSRNCRGAAIVQSSCLLTVVAGGTVLGTLLMANLGLAVYYQDKLTFVAQQAAKYAGREKQWSNSNIVRATDARVTATTAPVVQKLLRTMGLPEASNITVTTTQKRFVTVSMDVFGLSLAGGPGLPTFLNLRQSATYDMTDDQPPGLVTLTAKEGQMVVLPTYGKFIDGFSNGGRNPQGAPAGTAVFKNFNRQYTQFNMTLPGTVSP
jgi:hypothetical protein